MATMDPQELVPLESGVPQPQRQPHKNCYLAPRSCYRAPLKLCRLLILLIGLPCVFVFVPLYMKYRVFSGQMYPMSMTDMRLIDNKISPTWCQGQVVKSNATFNAFVVPGPPKLLEELVPVSMTRELELEDDMKEYWGFYLLKGSTVTVSTCVRWPGASLIMIKGYKHLQECAYIGDDSSEELDELIEAYKLGLMTNDTFNKRIEELKKVDGKANDPETMRRHKAGVSFHDPKVVGNVTASENVPIADITDNDPKELRAILEHLHAIRQAAKDEQLKYYHPPSHLMSLPALNGHRDGNVDKDERKFLSFKDIDGSKDGSTSSQVLDVTTATVAASFKVPTTNTKDIFLNKSPDKTKNKGNENTTEYNKKSRVNLVDTDANVNKEITVSSTTLNVIESEYTSTIRPDDKPISKKNVHKTVEGPNSKDFSQKPKEGPSSKDFVLKSNEESKSKDFVQNPKHRLNSKDFIQKSEKRPNSKHFSQNPKKDANSEDKRKPEKEPNLKEFVPNEGPNTNDLKEKKEEAMNSKEVFEDVLHRLQALGDRGKRVLQKLHDTMGVEYHEKNPAKNGPNLMSAVSGSEEELDHLRKVLVEAIDEEKTRTQRKQKRHDARLDARAKRELMLGQVELEKLFNEDDEARDYAAEEGLIPDEYADHHEHINETTAFDMSNSEFWSSFSSSEEALLECDGLILNLPLTPHSSCTKDSSLKEMGAAARANALTYRVPTNGYYFFVFNSENEVQRNFIRAKFDLQKTRYDVARTKLRECTNSTEKCSLPLDLFSSQKVVLEVPLRDNDSLWNEQFVIISECEPRTSIYMACVIAVPILIMLFAFQ